MQNGALATTPHAEGLATVVPRPNRRSENIPYLIGIDHLRCCAALLIVYFHGVQVFAGHARWSWILGQNAGLALILEGHTAVAMFMVLSGFIFAFGTADRHISYRQFLANRFFRTYPLFIFLVVAGSAVFHRQLQLAPLLQVLLGGANLLGSQDLGGFSAVLWAVAVEWQFYVLFPALMAVVHRVGAAWLWYLLALVAAARGTAYFLGLAPVDSLYPHLLGRIDQFVLGMIAGLLYRNAASHRWFRAALGPALAAVFMGAYAFNQFGGWPREHWVRIITPSVEGLLWAAVVAGYLAVSERTTRAPGRLSRVAASIGAISYSVYLWHFMFLQIQRSRGWTASFVADPALNAVLLVTLTSLPVILLFSALSYHAIEKPFLALRKSYTSTAVSAFPR